MKCNDWETCDAEVVVAALSARFSRANALHPPCSC